MTVEDRLRSAHARIPDPDEATIARARALLAAAESGASAHTAREEAPPAGTPRAAPSGRARPSARAASSRPRRAPARIALPLAALALAAVAAFAVLPRDVERPAPAKPVTGQVLYQRNAFHMSTMYIGADGRPTPGPRDAAYAITRSVPEEIWLAPDGSGRVAYGKESAPAPASPADERAWRAAGAPDLAALMGPPGRWGPKRTDYGPGGFEAAHLSSSNLDVVLPDTDRLSVLPRGQWELREFLMRAAGKQRPEGPPQLVRDTFADDALTFLRYPQVPRDLRAALLMVLRNVEGGRDLGYITDATGREVRAFQLPEDMEWRPGDRVRRRHHDARRDRFAVRGRRALEHDLRCRDGLRGVDRRPSVEHEHMFV